MSYKYIVPLFVAVFVLAGCGKGSTEEVRPVAMPDKKSVENMAVNEEWESYESEVAFDYPKGWVVEEQKDVAGKITSISISSRQTYADNFPGLSGFRINFSEGGVGLEGFDVIEEKTVSIAGEDVKYNIYAASKEYINDADAEFKDFLIKNRTAIAYLESENITFTHSGTEEHLALFPEFLKSFTK